MRVCERAVCVRNVQYLFDGQGELPERVERVRLVPAHGAREARLELPDEDVDDAAVLT